MKCLFLISLISFGDNTIQNNDKQNLSNEKSKSNINKTVLYTGAVVGLLSIGGIVFLLKRLQTNVKDEVKGKADNVDVSGVHKEMKSDIYNTKVPLMGKPDNASMSKTSKKHIPLAFIMESLPNTKRTEEQIRQIIGLYSRGVERFFNSTEIMHDDKLRIAGSVFGITNIFGQFGIKKEITGLYDILNSSEGGFSSCQLIDMFASILITEYADSTSKPVLLFLKPTTKNNLFDFLSPNNIAMSLKEYNSQKPMYCISIEYRVKNDHVAIPMLKFSERYSPERFCYIQCLPFSVAPKCMVENISANANALVLKNTKTAQDIYEDAKTVQDIYDKAFGPDGDIAMREYLQTGVID